MIYLPEKFDFSSIKVENVDLPYSSNQYLRLSYNDPALSGYEVTVILDSKTQPVHEKSVLEGLPEDFPARLSTIIARFPRCILSEVNTHRVFSRNSASSRARSVKTTIAQVVEDPYIPLFTKNQKGMSGKFLSESDRKKAVFEWLEARDRAVESELRLLLGSIIPENLSASEVTKDYAKWVDVYYDTVYNADEPDVRAPSVHKQNANRLIEPFMWHEAIITSSFWSNFENLRTDFAHAQPEIYALAVLIVRALQLSKPKDRWIHAPFIAESDIPALGASFNDLREILLLSATECAQVSYKDKSRSKVSTASTKLGERLLEDGHFSPFEHIALSREGYSNTKDLPEYSSSLISNLDTSWVQFRKILSA